MAKRVEDFDYEEFSIGRLEVSPADFKYIHKTAFFISPTTDSYTLGFDELEALYKKGIFDEEFYENIDPNIEYIKVVQA